MSENPAPLAGAVVWNPSIWQRITMWCRDHRLERFNPWYKEPESGLLRHARTELKAAGYFDKDPNDELGDSMNELMAANVLELIETFAKQGHSGFSAQFCISLFDRLAKYHPLCPLTGEDSEWMDVSQFGGRNDTPLFQNNRCFSVFKDAEGAWDIDMVYYKDPSGATFTRGGCRERNQVTFPYVPGNRICIKVDEEGNEIPNA